MRHRRYVLQNTLSVACSSNAFIFSQFRTLLRNGRLATPFPSITSALFPVQRRGRGSHSSPNFQTFKRATFKRNLSPLECALTKNRGGGGIRHVIFLFSRHSSLATRHFLSAPKKVRGEADGEQNDGGSEVLKLSRIAKRQIHGVADNGGSREDKKYRRPRIPGHAVGNGPAAGGAANGKNRRGSQTVENPSDEDHAL